MSRLIEVEDVLELPDRLRLAVGDLLRIAASGGHVRDGTRTVEMLGPFLTSVVGTNGDVIAPMGPPNTVFFLVRGLGDATIDVVTGDPWHAPRTTVLELSVTA